MRNMHNAITKVLKHKGLLSKSIVVGTAKNTLNQYDRGWIKPNTTELCEVIGNIGAITLFEKPLLGRKLDAKLTEQGIKWLNSIAFKKDGSCRNSKIAQVLGDREFEVIRNFSHFTFGGFYRADDNQFYPIWDVHHTDGIRSFSYVYGGWMSGCGFEIVG